MCVYILSSENNAYRIHNLVWFLIWEFTNIVTEKVIYSEFSVGCELVPNAVTNIYCAIKCDELRRV